MKNYFLLFLLTTLMACATTPKIIYNVEATPPAPDYSNPNHWAALPTKEDLADHTPDESMQDKQAQAAVDVFWLHPTSYTRERGNTEWNGDINDAELNEKTDKGSILNQASIFNGAGRVYAPRYRQAHIYAYFAEDKASAKKAFALAYSDVKRAFEYYLEHYNNGRPIIIASHSQGTTHASQLLKEFFDGKPLQSQLVAAYLVGMPVAKNYFEQIKPCEAADETGCFVSWRSYQRDFFPKSHQADNELLSTNPLTWTIDDAYADESLNKGAVLRKWEDGLWKNLADAQNSEGILWVTKPKFPGSFLIRFKNYHVADYNFFYANIRENAQTRTQQYLEDSRNTAKNNVAN